MTLQEVILAEGETHNRYIIRCSLQRLFFSAFSQPNELFNHPIFSCCIGKVNFLTESAGSSSFSSCCRLRRVHWTRSKQNISSTALQIGTELGSFRIQRSVTRFLQIFGDSWPFLKLQLHLCTTFRVLSVITGVTIHVFISSCSAQDVLSGMKFPRFRTPRELLSEVYLCRHACTKIAECELHPGRSGVAPVVIHQPERALAFIKHAKCLNSPPRVAFVGVRI